MPLDQIPHNYNVRAAATLHLPQGFEDAAWEQAQPFIFTIVVDPLQKMRVETYVCVGSSALSVSDWRQPA